MKKLIIYGEDVSTEEEAIETIVSSISGALENEDFSNAVSIPEIDVKKVETMLERMRLEWEWEE